MEEHFKLETERLIKSWTKYDHTTLRNYLVEDVQDPRINVQSILTRHWLIKCLLGEQLAELMDQELRFSLVMNWLLKLLKKSVNADQLRDVLYELLSGENNADGLEIPSYILDTFNTLSMPNYICDLLNWAPVETTEAPIPEYLMSIFQSIWQESLANVQSRQACVMEPACGSANDYRFLEAFGISRLIDYVGFDLCEKNISNAKQMFPKTSFKVDNVFNIDAKDNEFDYCFVYDLFEHLSIDAMIKAISEICRTTQQSLCISFFNMYDGDQHIVQAVDDYYWNKLSVAETEAIFKCYASVVEVIHIDKLLLSKFGCRDTHNKNAYTFIIRM